MALLLTVFCLVGALFGLTTASRRHLFSEGHSRPGARDGWRPRAGWVLLCTLLWPLMLLTGAFNAANARARHRAMRRDVQQALQRASSFDTRRR